MKYKIILWFFLSGCFFACQNDDITGFDVPVEFRKALEFRPVPGGAVMKYYLPDNTDIFGVRVRYNDCRGELLTKDGSYLIDSILLPGFNEQEENVPARVSFFNNRMEESEPIEVTFSTKASAASALFDSLTVNPFWGGFNVTYRSPETVNGTLHVFYLGTNPLTHQPDSILILTAPIAEDGDTLNFVIKQKMDMTTVVVRTEDYRGYRVKQKLFEDLPMLNMDTLRSSDFDFSFTGPIVESEEFQMGLKYLFDGDKTGREYRKNRLSGDKLKYSTFVAGPEAFDKRFVVDLRSAKIPASVRLYVYLNFHSSWPWNNPFPGSTIYPPLLVDVWNRSYRAKLPSKIRLYGTNEDPRTVSLSSCASLFRLDDNAVSVNVLKTWAARTDDYYSADKDTDYLLMSDDEFAEAEPIFLDMLCNYSGEAYRYLIFVVGETYDAYNEFGTHSKRNTREYVSFNELEVCVKAE